MQVNMKYLHHIAKNIAPKNDVRFYLNGVMLEIDDTGRYYVATNGHMLVSIREPREDDDINGQHIFPRDALISLKPGKRTDYAEFTLDAGIATLTVGNDSKMFKLIDGNFPTWRRVVPPRVTLEMAQYNPEYLVSMTDTYKACFHDLKNTGLYLMPNGNGTALYQGCDSEWLGIIMPIRFDKDDAIMPRFIKTVVGPETPELHAVA